MPDDVTPDDSLSVPTDGADAPSSAVSPSASMPKPSESEVSSVAANAEEEASAPSAAAQELLAQALQAFGKDVIESDFNFGDVVIRVTKEGYANAAKISKDALGCDYLSFVAGIDWLPMPMEAEEGSGDTSQPAQPREMTFGVAGSAGRFQVFSHVQSTSKHLGLTIKVDVDESDMKVASWTDVYPGADWHERECWEMYGIDFVGHPEIRHLYLPGEFEGFPLRKDFPLLARVVKPWPGLVDVEPMPGDDSSDDEGDE